MSLEGILEAKVVLLGATMVGKTTLVTQFTLGEFDPSIKSTIGACYASKIVTVDRETIKLQIWDTAGQEKFKTLVPMYFRGAKVAILAFSVCDTDSKKEVVFWANSVKQSSSQIPKMFVVGNKIDLANNRVVSKEDGRELAKEIGADYFEVSAMEGTGVEELLSMVAKSALEAVKADAPQPKSAVITSSKKTKTGCC